MSHWNHRVIKSTTNGEDWYSVREVFYNEDNTIYAYTEEPIDISGSSIDELKEYLQWCLNCLDKPILVDDEVKFIDNYKPCDICNDMFVIPCPACGGNSKSGDCARCHGSKTIDCPKCCSEDSD